MDANTITAILSIGVAGVSAWAAVVAIRQGRKALVEQVRAEHLSHNLQATIYCQQRYQALEAQRLELKGNPKATGPQIESFFRNYWTLKADQFDYWLGGYIDHDTFKDWIESTARLFGDSKANFLGHPFVYGWVHFGRPFHVKANPIFVRFHDALLEIIEHPKSNKDRSLAILHLMEEIDNLNLKVKGNSKRIIKSRRFGAPETITILIKEIDEQNRSEGDVGYLFNTIWGDDYALLTHQKTLRDRYPPISS